MEKLARLKAHIAAHKQALDLIMYDVYTDLAVGCSDFAMFDGGAHKGWHAWRMIQLPGCGSVYAVEADPTMNFTLTENLASWHKEPVPILHIVNKALQSREDLTSIPWLSSHSHPGRSSIRSEKTGKASIWEDHRNVAYRPETRVLATTIDAILRAEARPLPFVKLDLEGADMVAMFGARETMQLRRPVIAFENSSKAPEVHGYTLDDVRSFFSDVGYVPLDYTGAAMRPETWFAFHEAWAVPAEKLSRAAPLIEQAVDARLTI